MIEIKKLKTHIFQRKQILQCSANLRRQGLQMVIFCFLIFLFCPLFALIHDSFVYLLFLKARCHYQSFPSETLSTKTWTKCLLSLSKFVLSSLSKNWREVL